MAEMGAKVWSVEIVEEFAEAAKLRLQVLGYDIQVRDGDGVRGWPEHAPFDAILVTAAAAAPPQSLLDQLKPGGRMVLPVGDKDGQQLTLVEKKLDGGTLNRAIMPVTFSQLEI
jgi:protein-L-isoaspartate(D-aspartate) O-methyltransferase